MRTVVIRCLIGVILLGSLSCGAIAGLGLLLTMEATNVDWVNGSVVTECEEAVKRGEYKDQPACVVTTYKYFSFLSMGLYVAGLSCVMALTLFAIAIITLRNHLRTLRKAQQGAP